MLTRTAVVVGLVAVLGVAGAGQQKPLPESATKAIQLFKSELPKIKEEYAALKNQPAPSIAAGPLPTPSLVEPFEIGEALYDPGRMADAVVSLLALMQIAVLPDSDVNAKAATGKGGITLSESEVHALINLASEDFEGADDIENLPYGFAELHAGVADLLPGVSVEQLAETYSRAYEARPEDLIPKAMMGRPIEPDMKISRAQIWFLLMDGFAGAASTNGRWGTADKLIADLKSPNAQWTPEEFREVLARLPLVTASRLVTMSAPEVISQGATAGPPVNVTARVNASAPPLVSRATGRTLIAPRAGSLSGQEVTWHVHEESMLPELGKITTPVDDKVPVGADGLARFTFQPGVDPTKGAGQLVDDWETVDARFETRGLVANAYAVPASLARMTIGTSQASGNVHLRWRSADVLHLFIANIYTNINFEIPGLGGGTRDGMDIAAAKLYKRTDGSYTGRGGALVTMTQTLRGGSCANATTIMRQQVRVKAESETDYPMGPTRVPEHYVWITTQIDPLDTWASTSPDGGYYRLLFFPVTEPAFSRACIPNIPAEKDRKGWGAKWFIPFNDAQWTRSGQGYPMALRARGFTGFADLSSADPLASTPLEAVKTAFKLTGVSSWFVLLGRTEADLSFIGSGK